MHYDGNNDSPRRRGKSRHQIEEREHDPYGSRAKPAQPTECQECGAIFVRGRWTWRKTSELAVGRHEWCPACRRIKERVPAGMLTLSGQFFHEHYEEILGLVTNIERHEKAEHPMRRIMTITRKGDGAVVTFTDPQLAHAVVDAIHNAYDGNMTCKYSTQEMFLRATWSR